MTRFWVRFLVRGVNDPRPTIYPIPIEWWCTGYEVKSDGSEDAINCAIVDAVGEAHAWTQITTYWPEAEQSFIEPRDSTWRPDPGRFPAKTRRS